MLKSFGTSSNTDFPQLCQYASSMTLRKLLDVRRNTPRKEIGRRDGRMFEFVVDDKVVLKLLDTIYAEQLFELTDACRPYLKEWLPWVDGTKSGCRYQSIY